MSEEAVGRRRMVTGALFLFPVLVAAALRVHHIDASFHVSELLTYETACRPMSQILSGIMHPLYYALGHMSIYTFGDTEAWLRMPSIVAGILGVMVIFYVGLRLGGLTCGFTAATLLAFNAYHIEHSHRARFYALLMLCGIAALWLLHESVTKGGFWRWAAFVLMSMAGSATHEYFIPFVGCMYLGAGVWVIYTRKRKSLKTLALLTLCLLLGMSTFFAVALRHADLVVASLKPANEELVEADEEVLEQINARDRERFDNVERYALTQETYLPFYKEYFPYTSPWAGWLLLALALVGFVYGWRRSMCFGMMATFVVFFLPLPFTLIKIPNNPGYLSRYFSIQIPVAILLAALGVAALAHVMARVFQKFETETQSEERARGLLTLPAFASAAVAALVLLSLARPTWATVSHTYDTLMPVRDYRGCVNMIAKTLRPGDVWVFCDGRTNVRRIIRRNLFFYLERMEAGGAVLPLNTIEAGSLKQLENIVKDYPARNIYILSQSKAFPAKAGALDSLIDGYHAFRDLELRIIGEPTRNLFTNGGFEHELTAYQQGPGLAWTGPEEAYAGAHAVRIDVSSKQAAEDFSVKLRMPVNVEPKTETVVREEFDTWSDALPEGWTPYQKSAAAIAQAESDSNSQALLFRETAEAAFIDLPLPEVDLAAREFVLTVRGVAAAPEQLIAALVCSAAGKQRVFSATHAGTGQWESIKVPVGIPADADPGSLYIRLGRLPNGEGGVAIDDVLVEAVESGEVLREGMQYTFSAQIKYEGLSQGKNPAEYFKIGMIGRDSDNKPRWTPFFTMARQQGLDGSRDWYQLALAIIAGETVPAGLHRVEIVVGNFGGNGTLWIDNMQLEPKPYVTPFTDSERVPHNVVLNDRAAEQKKE